MALSKSFQKGQVPISCQMCEESSDIKWKCIQCDFLLCTKCQRLHEKVKSTDQHTIIDIKDIASHQKQTMDKPDFSNILCGIHAGQNCCLYCQSCEVVVCPLCITKIHNKHKMIELDEGYELTLKSLKKIDSEIEKEVGQNETELRKLGILKSTEDSKYELEKQKINSHEKYLKDEVEKHTSKLMKELDQRKEMLMDSVNDAKNRSEKTNKDLNLRRNNLSQAFNSNNANKIFSIYSEEKTLRNQTIEHVKTTFKKIPTFVPQKLEVKEFKFGSLVETDDDKKQFELKVIKQYQTTLPLVENLVCSCDDEIWISYLFNHKLQKMKLTNESLQKMHSFKIAVYHMALLPSGDLLLSTKESHLKILSCSTSKVEPTKYSVSPFITLAVHVTSDHKIIVGAREDQPKSFPVNGPRQVIMMSMDGKIEKVYQRENKGKQIFTLPFRITTDNDNNIYVIDILNKDWNGRILALDKASGVRWIYSGNPDMNKEQTLKPKDLVATKSDNIIVADQDNHTIHILNTSGQCIHNINTKDQLGIELPCSVDIDNRGILYIGCNTYNNEKAKIYTVQISGF